MKQQSAAEAVEKLIRLRAPRRGTIVELLVHYQKACRNGCLTYEILRIEELK